LHLIGHAICYAVFQKEKQYYTMAIIYAYDMIFMSLWVVILNYFAKKCVTANLTIICEKQIYILFLIMFILHMVLATVGWAIFKMEEQMVVVGVLVVFDITFLVCFPLLLNLFSGVCPS
jgi:hypothetical protein